MRDDASDLLLGSHCLGCEAPGRLVCRSCQAELPRRPRPAWPTPVPSGLLVPWATGEYAGLVKLMVLCHKERRMLALAGPLGDLLAQAVACVVHGAAGTVVLVPVPSRRSGVRARGHDPTYAMCLRAARRLRQEGVDVVVRRLLVLRPGVIDQSGLDADARARNLAGSMTCPSPGLRRLARRRGPVTVVVCDDVLTTGSTAREAQRALQAVGLPVSGIATVAATRRRHTRREQS